ncbi:MAG: hypothetical protein AAFX03_06950 [Pseudomonadota bacterium]
MRKQDLVELARTLVRQAQIVKRTGAKDLARAIARRGLAIRSLAVSLERPQPALVPARIRRR